MSAQTIATSTRETASAGPAPGRPATAPLVWWSQPTIRSMTGESIHLAVWAGLPPIAVPMTVKMPEPMTAPMPRAVSDTGPSVFWRQCSGRSDSEISLSMDLVAKICLGKAGGWLLAKARRRCGFGDLSYYAQVFTSSPPVLKTPVGVVKFVSGKLVAGFELVGFYSAIMVPVER